MSSAAGASIANAGSVYAAPPGQTIFNDTSTARAARPSSTPELARSHSVTAARQLSMAHLLRRTPPSTIWTLMAAVSVGQSDFQRHIYCRSRDDHQRRRCFHGGKTVFDGSSTADSAILIANGVGEVAVRFFLMALRRAAPRGWRFLTMVIWILAAGNRALPSALSRAQEMFS